MSNNLLLVAVFGTLALTGCRSIEYTSVEMTRSREAVYEGPRISVVDRALPVSLVTKVNSSPRDLNLEGARTKTAINRLVADSPYISQGRKSEVAYTVWKTEVYYRMLARAVMPPRQDRNFEEICAEAVRVTPNDLADVAQTLAAEMPEYKILGKEIELVVPTEFETVTTPKQITADIARLMYAIDASEPESIRREPLAGRIVELRRRATILVVAITVNHAFLKQLQSPPKAPEPAVSDVGALNQFFGLR
jgi:hypothetical protein